ncbi:MAG: oligoendopeptidase F [Treponema sp.]|nr:oligoendopeptidase F [Treponema sp.]
METKKIPLRSEVSEKDKWDLSTLYKSDKDWEIALESIPSLIENLVAFKGKLAENSNNLLNALKAYESLFLTAESVYNYASLKHTADESDTVAQEQEGRAMMNYVNADTKSSFVHPELMSIDDAVILEWSNLPEFKDYKVYLKKQLYLKPYILSEKEEKLLSLQAESAQTSKKAFGLLTNVDINFGTVTVDEQEQPLTQSTWSLFMENQNREIRKEAYCKFYGEFEKHQNTIATLYAGSVNQDVFEARARGYKSSLAAALYSNKVEESVYKNLIKTVHDNFNALHRFYALRKKVLGLSELRHYDVYVPLVKDLKTNTTYEEAVEICRNALSPLGTEYTDTLCNGLLNGWVDRYENKGKRSGAFSSGSYNSYPYILLNYKNDAIRDVFTMAHEGGHSMHSYYSSKNNPFMSYDYTIFEAEVASTFNEELVFQYLLKNSSSKEMSIYLLAMRANDILATLHRQTMFAEFELKTHEMVENGIPLSASNLRQTYRTLLEQYFGPEMIFENNSDMEGLRIPHFYNAFYVYKYATGISAALALAKRVTEGGEKEKQDYFNFLKSGGSRYPLESLAVAGVDMTTSKPIQDALNTFEQLVNELEKLLINS